MKKTYFIKISGKKMIVNKLFNKLTGLVGTKTGFGKVQAVSRNGDNKGGFIEIMFEGSIIRRFLLRKVLKEIQSLKIEES